VILFGEHAVVYGQPALAAPVTQVRATASVEDAPTGRGLCIDAADLRLRRQVQQALTPDDPLYAIAATVRHTLDALGVEGRPDLALCVSSSVPMGRGLGSGAALATAIVRALALHLGHPLQAQEVSDLVYQTEVIHHGTPSGIDNTVIAFEQPVYFVKEQSIQILQVGRPFWLAIGDTGIASPTRDVVGDVRRRWQREPARYEDLFDRIGAIAVSARDALASGQIAKLGRLMDENQALLERLDVSCPELDGLIQAARQAGATGAKLCGAGRGGNMIALVAQENAESVAAALRQARAVNVIVTEVKSPRPLRSQQQRISNERSDS
jgi:mevalonate kinase